MKKTLEETLLEEASATTNDEKKYEGLHEAKLEVDGEVFTFSLDRRSCIKAEKKGFSILQMASSPAAMSEILWFVALQKNHPSYTEHMAALLRDKAEEQGINTMAIIDFLLEKYSDFSLATKADTKGISFN